MAILAKIASFFLRSRLGQFLLGKILEELVGLFRDWQLKKEVEQKNKEIQKSADDLTKANEIKDQDERLKAKADAACKLEKLGNPDSDCDK